MQKCAPLIAVLVAYDITAYTCTCVCVRLQGARRRSWPMRHATAEATTVTQRIRVYIETEYVQAGQPAAVKCLADLCVST